MKRNKKTYLAEMLLDQKLITQEQLNVAIAEQKKSDKKIGQVLVDLGFVKEDQLLQLLSRQLHVPFIDLRNFQINSELVKLLPEFQSRQSRAIVLKDDGNSYTVGMVDPQDLFAVEDIERVLNRKINIALIREDDLLAILDTVYRRTEEITHFAETLSQELKPSEVIATFDTTDTAQKDLPVVNLLRSIFEDAVQVNASDIHIEPGENILRIRLRIDGVLQEQIIEEKAITSALVQRIKMMSGLNIAEKRLPQDGRFSIKVKNKKLDVRVSTIPIQYGESVVMRLLDQSAESFKLSQIGMPEGILHEFKKILTSSYGLLLIVGPTGSGKTSTLYAALNILNKAEDKIITVEDPVEYQLPRINQVQVNNQINLTFANILRSVLRQDPDIILIGEMRDQETVDIALRAAMTGHFVMATLHTNDTVGAAPRLLDMGAEGYIVASVLKAIMAQRLVRRSCHFCLTDDPLTDQERIWLDSVAKVDYKSVTFKKGTGCTQCHNTGYQGRIGVFELLVMSEELAEALRQRDLGLFVKLAKQQKFYVPLLKSGVELAVKGVTTVQEIIRMAGEL